MRRVITTALVVVLISCGSRKPAETASTETAGTSAAPATYTPRIGVAVNTGGRTCLAVHNANVAPTTPVTLVSPMPPQTFIQAEITGPSQSACPVTKEVDPTVSNYDIRLSQGSVPKLAPLIAVLGASAPFSMAPNNSVQADLDQDGKMKSFRACSASNGVHLTVWFRNPLDGTLLWHGYYYEASNPGLGPSCTAREMAGP
ncbi:MAG: hypothetical protein ACJ74Z_14410 [Bryobacteraceae bacterium]